MRQENISIGIFEPVSEMTGGRAYRQALGDVLGKNYEVEVFDVAGSRGIVPSVRLRRMLAIARVNKAKDIWIRDFYPVAGMRIRRNPGANIGLFLHLYTEGETLDALGRILEPLFFRNIHRCDRVVAISEFWKDYLRGRGVADVRVIRNGFDVSQFELSVDEVHAFRTRHGLLDSPVIYIGNCRRIKGVVEAHEALKGRGYQLVTSGEPDVSLPCPNLNVSYREYLLLLKASSVVVTMSKFREGWCRTSHEAMLCKTPVVGSGAGGMAELLEGGKQFLCRDPSELPHLVETAMDRKDELGSLGYRFASAFTLERFEKEWSDLIEEVAQDRSGTR